MRSHRSFPGPTPDRYAQIKPGGTGQERAVRRADPKLQSITYKCRIKESHFLTQEGAEIRREGTTPAHAGCGPTAVHQVPSQANKAVRVAREESVINPKPEAAAEAGLLAPVCSVILVAIWPIWTTIHTERLTEIRGIISVFPIILFYLV